MCNLVPNRNDQLCDSSPSYDLAHRTTGIGYPHNLDSNKFTIDLEGGNCINTCLHTYIRYLHNLPQYK